MELQKAFHTVDLKILFILTKTWNELKQPETGQNDLKSAKKTKKWRNDLKQPKTFKLGISGIFWNFCFFNFKRKCPNLGILGQKVLTF